MYLFAAADVVATASYPWRRYCMPSDTIRRGTCWRNTSPGRKAARLRVISSTRQLVADLTYPCVSNSTM